MKKHQERQHNITNENTHEPSSNNGTLFSNRRTHHSVHKRTIVSDRTMVQCVVQFSLLLVSILIVVVTLQKNTRSCDAFHPGSSVVTVVSIAPKKRTLMQQKNNKALLARPGDHKINLATRNDDNNNNKKEDEGDDDGWGFDISDEVMKEYDNDNLPASVIAKDTSPAAAKEEGKDRDLFIPLFALLSLAGLIGLYSFEMMRLYFAGELYLPFLH
jgi:hypothetical protein